MLLDSVLGVTLQEQRKCVVCGQKVEVKNHCEKKTEKYSGLSWFNNDMVNMTATAFGGIIAGIFTFFFIF
jgi:uncharacterized membrane protein